MPTSAAEQNYVSRAFEARKMVPFEIPREINGKPIPLDMALDLMFLQVAKSRHILTSSKPSPRLAKAHATFKSALDEIYDATKFVRAAIAKQDEAGFYKANLARIEASKKVNLASKQHSEILGE